MYKNGKLLIGKNEDKEVYLLPKMANRHGLITGASGSGKTITLKVMAESFSDAGIPVFLVDVKGDLAGMCFKGTLNENIEKRVNNLGLDDFDLKSFPTTFYDMYGKLGHPIRTTVAKVGYRLMSRMLSLSDTGEEVLGVVFKVARDENLELNDLNDLNSVLSYVSDNRQKYFYDIRTEYNSYSLNDELNIKRASEFIFLNRTCFNGLYRVNKDGKFNVPCGKYKNPTICDSNNLRNLSKLIQNVTFEYGDYRKSENLITENTFVYFDPPYRPLSVTSGFTSYTKEDFNDENQKELAHYYNQLNLKNAKLMLSNSNPKNVNDDDNFFDTIYNGFIINEVSAKRMINSNAKGRGEISELLITNYEEQSKWNSQTTSTIKMEALA